MKKDLGKEYIKVRESIPNRILLDDIITNKVLTNSKVLTSDTILIYVSYKSEVSTLKLIKELLKIKKVAVPKVEGKIMNFYYINSFSDLTLGYHGILEPSPMSPVKDYSSAICITPGLCFSSDGYRLGYGGGYYDKFLEEHPVYTIGLAYHKCLIKRLPHEPHDKKIDEIITDNLQ